MPNFYTFTVSGAPTSTITSTGIGALVSNNDIVTVQNSGGALPAPLATSTNYYIVSLSTNTLGLSLSSGGAAITLTTNGSGTNQIVDGWMGHFTTSHGLSATDINTMLDQDRVWQDTVNANGHDLANLGNVYLAPGKTISGVTQVGFLLPESAPYNATGLGVTDDTIALAAAYNAASGKTLWLSGTYLLKSICRWTASNVTVQGPGKILCSAPADMTFTVSGSPTTTITCTGVGAVYSVGSIVQVSNSGGALPTGLSTATDYYIVSIATNSLSLALTAGGTPISCTTNGTGTSKIQGNAFVSLAGTRGATTTISSSLPLASRFTQATKTFSVASAAGISAGTTLSLSYSDGTFSYSQVGLVQSVSGSAITMVQPVVVPLLSTQTGNIQIITPVTGVDIRDISFDGSGTSASATAAYGLTLSCYAECSFDNLRFSGFNTMANTAGLAGFIGRDNNFSNISLVNCGSGNVAAFNLTAESDSEGYSIRGYGDGSTTQDAFGILFSQCTGTNFDGIVMYGFAGRAFKMVGCAHLKFNGVKVGGTTNKAQLAMAGGNYRDMLWNLEANEATSVVSNAVGFEMFGIENAFNTIDGFIGFNNANVDFYVAAGLGGASGNNHDNKFLSVRAGIVQLEDGGNSNNIYELDEYTTLTNTCNSTNFINGIKGWVVPTFQHSWTDPANGNQGPTYTIDRKGTVLMRGNIVGGTTTDATVLFTLPTGFRPPAHVFFFTTAVVGGVFTVVEVEVASTGDVKIFGASALTTPIVWLGFSFSTV